MIKNSLNRPVLVVDDEQDIRDLMEMTLMKMGLNVETAEGVNIAKKKLTENKYSLVLTDMRMPDGSGLEVVEHIMSNNMDTPVAVITAFGNADQAVQALKIGAFDYLQKPITLAQLRTLVKSAVKVQDEYLENKAKPDPETEDHSVAAEPVKKNTVATPPPVADVPTQMGWGDTDWHDMADMLKQNNTGRGRNPNVSGSLKNENEMVEPTVQSAQLDVVENTGSLKREADVPRILGSSQQIEEARRLIRKLADSNVPVYISGESGTGKEQAARSIHELSSRADKPFIAVNCGAIPENLMESEFFGYKKGSFTGADQDRLGFFQHAHGGTLFLDEVADLPLAMQVKLLRAIQEKAVRRIGDAQEAKVDVRIISATHKNLEHLVDSGAFRQDLFYRLNVVTLKMPPLREMHEDLERLIVHLLRKHHGTGIRMTAAARDALLHYGYPGNFRELENILERAVALASNNTIDVEDLQINHQPMDLDSEHFPLAEDIAATGLPNFQMGHTQLQDYLDDVERQILQQALEYTKYNRTQAAKVLGISFRSMRYRLDRLAIE
ncbi:sigma-54-dependent transcriptional regulator [Alysiella crassa]|uniref:Transcriptional regulatory protein ZraR n=1 Tax=Alysiella crassa TaxID=153491 RepID=A0A376BTU8_9NEIS|nr:sigma-54 dependent transcriptional regulator [Alysiella crassa]UOP05941.1 sigma-54 dependent transcriptional regulator [Alysiella crassa]SSY80370.1 Transcriptional regulatory protein ZraR [Alysiella crassa]